MLSLAITALGGIFIAYASLAVILSITQDGKEPPAVATEIPFLSPLFGMTTRGINNWTFLRDKYKLPIYTLRLPGARIYVVNATSLIPAVQKPYRVLSFSPTLIKIASSVMGLSAPTLDVVKRDPTSNHGFIFEFHGLTHRAIAPGPGLEQLNERAVAILAASLDKMAAAGSPTKVRMFEWLSHEILRASTDAIFGPKNPFKDPANEALYHQYEPGLIAMVLGFAPYAAKQSIRARELLTVAVERYFSEGGHEDPGCSNFIKMRHEYYETTGIPSNDLARIETAGAIGILSNTMPTTFWVIWHILSDPVVLEDCRQELAGAVVEEDGVLKLDVGYVQSSCPILFSTFREAFRFHGIGVSAREVLEDYTLDGKYLLKKGGILLIPGAVQHSSVDSWGENAGEYYHKRFMRNEKRYNPVAFRGFGGGATLCPGRHFASTEIMAFAAMIILRFNARPLSGSWVMPTTKNSNPATSIHQPDTDVDIELVPRDNRKWTAIFSSPKKPMVASAEDLEGN